MEIKFSNVSFVIDYKTPLEKTILDDVSFEIDKPGIYSFVGPSNSGKSSIGDLINALIIPTKGNVKIGSFINDGRHIKKSNKLRIMTGYVYKNPYDMFINKTVKKELEFGMKYFKFKMDKIALRPMDALRLVNLDESYLDKDPLTLSLIDAKKIALACVLIYNPKIIILDEFTNGLSYYDKVELKKLLKLLKNKYGKIIILLTKDTDFVYQVTDYVYLMHLTKIVNEGNKEILRNVELLNSIDLKAPSIVEFINEANKDGHDIDNYTDILELIKGVYRDVF